MYLRTFKIQNTGLEIHKLDPARFRTSPGLAWQADIKKTKVKLDLSTNINMLLVVEKGINLMKVEHVRLFFDA